MKLKTLAAILAPAVLAAVAGCSTTREAALQDVASSTSRIEQYQKNLKDTITKAEAQRVAQQEVARPYLAGNTQPLAREATMPDALRKSVPVTALFSAAPVDLMTALGQVGQAAGISVTATADAMMPASAFGPRQATPNANPIQAPTRVTVRASNTPLWSVLDDLARQSGTSWRPVAGGAEFYRVQTRVFELMGLPQSASTSASLGRQGGANALFNSQSNSSFELKDQNVMNGIKTAVDALLTAGGKMTISNETQTLIVTDTTESLDRIEAYVKEHRKAASRRVRLLVEAIEVVAKDTNDVGIDWSLAYGAANAALATTSPASLVSSLAGGTSISAPAGSGPGAGTALVLKALNEVGRVVNRRTFPMMTTSGRPITQAIRSTFNYVDQVQATAIASSVTTTAQAPTVAQKDETVGTFLTILPTAKADGTVFLSVAFDVTSAEPLRPFTVGAGASAVTVQQKTINGSGTLQEVPVRSGRTEVIGGMEVLMSQSNARRVGEGAPMLLGGSDSSGLSKSVVVLLVTAVAEEGI
jgi:type IVB pilus formation R64 PilN family outer membrane protein